MSTPNHHYEYATSAFGAANASADPEFNEQVRSDALIQATLALVYEQRTANLIAMYTDGNTGTAPGVNYKDLLEAITERLDLA